LSLKVVTLMLR